MLVINVSLTDVLGKWSDMERVDPNTRPDISTSTYTCIQGVPTNVVCIAISETRRDTTKFKWGTFPYFYPHLKM